MQAIQNSWQQVISELQTSLPSHTFNTWIKPLQFREVKQSCLYLEVPNTFYRDRLQRSYASLIKAKLRQLTADATADVAFIVPKQPHVATELLKEISQKPSAADLRPTRQMLLLNQRYTFANFVVGDHNQMAHAAAQSVAHECGGLYNPLVLYGGVGLGKTHLLSAIGNHILNKQKHKRVIYKTSEQFMNELISAIRYQKTQEFRTLYRSSCDVLLIDDIQFLAGKEKTQEEFFHTFNALHHMNTQIVMTSDQPPSRMADLDSRLRSRFEWGLYCDIQAPDVETRMAILKKKAMAYQMDLTDDVAHYIARLFTSNIRSLEGALIKLSAFSSLSSQAISLDLVRQVFQDIAGQQDLSIDYIQSVVSKHFKVSVCDLMSKRRHQSITVPRQIAMYLCRKHIKASYPDIGKAFGGKDHTTVIHAIRKIEQEILSYQSDLHLLEKQLNRN